jgi:hypothetical protein
MQGSGDVIEYLSYPTFVSHIHLNKYLIINSLFMKVIIDMCFILLIKQLINVSFHNFYFMWGFNTSPFTSKGVHKDNYL